MSLEYLIPKVILIYKTGKINYLLLHTALFLLQNPAIFLSYPLSGLKLDILRKYIYS